MEDFGVDHAYVAEHFAALEVETIGLKCADRQFVRMSRAREHAADGGEPFGTTGAPCWTQSARIWSHRQQPCGSIPPLLLVARFQPAAQRFLVWVLFYLPLNGPLSGALNGALSVVLSDLPGGSWTSRPVRTSPPRCESRWPHSLFTAVSLPSRGLLPLFKAHRIGSSGVFR